MSEAVPADEVLSHQPGLRVEKDLNSAHSVTDAVFLDLILSRGLRHLEYMQSPGGLSLSEEIERVGSIVAADRRPSWREFVIELDGAVALLGVGKHTIDVNVAASSADILRRTVGLITKKIRSPQVEEDRVWVTFWAGNSEGRVSCSARRVQMPTWEDVSQDHPAATRHALASLVELKEPQFGTLILLHGTSGTGKTHVVRSLTRAWREWCTPHFITDPDLFLGDASYLLNVLTSSDPDTFSNRAWRLVILEDSGELLTADARQRTGQALSRLLNATDGLLGQSTNTLVLVTTNEPLGKLHPAVSRQGRCLAEIEFGPLGVDEANAWLKQRACKLRVSSPTTLADLYAMVSGRVSSRQQRPIGFAA